ncbi:MAG: leucine-rich repeat protein, partial [Bacteroidales bacterium]|nr:leucine-rich repeat protein [Bacteroidales bacterium]
IFLFILLGVLGAKASDFEAGGIYYNRISGATGQVEVTSGSVKYSGSVVIPSMVTYDGTTYSVTSIKQGAFLNCSGLTSVTLPESVTYIGWSAFKGCSGLTSVTLPESVDTIDMNAFYGCTSISSPLYNSKVFAYMPQNYSGEYAIPDGIQSIAPTAFYECTGLATVTIPESVTTIGEEAFGYCSGLTSVTIPHSVTSIGSKAFYSCSGLTVYYTGNIAQWCGIEFGQTISNNAWSLYIDNVKVTDLLIPDGMSSIGNRAFERCSGLTSVTIPNSVTSIGHSAFWGCSGLTSVTSLATTPPTCGGSVFTRWDTLYVPYGCKAAYEAAEEWKRFAVIKEIMPIYTVGVSANNSDWGSVSQSGNGTYDLASSATLTATPNEGYHFVKWNDDNTENPRVLTVTRDTAFTAEFAINTYTVTVNVNDESMGTVTGGGEYEHGEPVTLTATPDENYHF